jgi:hypothetical protein
MTTLAKALEGDAPTTTFLQIPAPRFVDVLENNGGVLVLNKETADVDSVSDSPSVATTRHAVSGSALSLAKAALEAWRSTNATPLDVGLTLVWASGIVDHSLHVLLTPSKSVATYAWCDSAFKIVSTKEFDLRPYLKCGAPQRILQIGAETAIVFSGGTVVAFPIPV